MEFAETKAVLRHRWKGPFKSNCARTTVMRVYQIGRQNMLLLPAIPIPTRGRLRAASDCCCRIVDFSRASPAWEGHWIWSGCPVRAKYALKRFGCHTGSKRRMGPTCLSMNLIALLPRLSADILPTSLIHHGVSGQPRKFIDVARLETSRSTRRDSCASGVLEERM